jgi:hypothetical protein
MYMIFGQLFHIRRVSKGTSFLELNENMNCESVSALVSQVASSQFKVLCVHVIGALR